MSGLERREIRERRAPRILPYDRERSAARRRRRTEALLWLVGLLLGGLVGWLVGR